VAEQSQGLKMIVRLWTTCVDKNRIAEYEDNEQNRSTPMFRQQPGCLGVLFLRSGENCFALTFWKDLESVERLKTSPSYLEASAFYSNSGMLLGEPSLQVFEVKGGFLNPEATAQARLS
jgi:heme-degrading monooxygenase HmoA